jgi:hypothetical protein
MIRKGHPGIFSQRHNGTVANITVAANDTFTFDYVAASNMTENLVVDWGDGNSDTYPPGSYSSTSATPNPIEHTYTSGGTYNIKFVGGDIEQIYRVDLISNTYVNSLDLSPLANYGASLLLYNNPNLTELLLPTSRSYSNISLYGNNLSDLNFKSGIMNGNGQGLNFHLYDNPLLSSMINLTIKEVGNFRTYNTLLDKDWDFENVLVFHNELVDYNGCGMSQVNQDANINAIYTNRAAFDPAGFPTVTCIGTTNPNATPSGTYDGTTDWSGGLPTSPMAKIYDLENNVTGTYNFNFTDVP